MSDEAWRTIPLSRGIVAIVDADDYDDLSQFKWTAFLGKNGKYYAARKDYVGRSRLHGKTEYMHRRIMKAPKGQEVDHIRDQETLDNRRSNLRFASHQQNLFNRGKQRNNTSGYKGVYWHAQTQKFQARIMLNKRGLSLGLFIDKVDAAKAYDAAALQYAGKFARLNFPAGF